MICDNRTQYYQTWKMLDNDPQTSIWLELLEMQFQNSGNRKELTIIETVYHSSKELFH